MEPFYSVGGAIKVCSSHLVEFGSKMHPEEKYSFRRVSHQVCEKMSNIPELLLMGRRYKNIHMSHPEGFYP